jgi:hypothetical protein
MKKIYFTMMILILGSAYLYADEIYLKDNSVIQGKIITVTAKTIEYDPEGDIPYDTIDRSKVVKIVYDNGKEVVLNEKAFKKLKIDKEDNEYQGISTKKSNEKEMISGRRYRDSFLYIGLVGAIGTWDGDLYTKETRLSKEYTGHDDDDDFVHGAVYYGGLELDLMVPGRIKFGVKGRWLGVIQEDQGEGEPSEDYLFSYNTWQVGPVIDAIVFETRAVTFSFQFYGLYGKIYNGTLNAMPDIRSHGTVSMDRSQYHRHFRGYTWSTGGGPRITFERGFPITLGMNLNYTFAKFKFDNALPLYGSDHTSYGAVSVEFSAGFAF